MNLFHCCLQRCGRGWMPCVCFCSLSLSSPSQGRFVRVCLRPRGYWGSSEFARRHTSPLLQTELCACFSHRDNSCVIAVANWVTALTVNGYCSRLRLSKGIVALLFWVILNTSLSVKRDAVGGECLFFLYCALPLFLYSKGGEGSWLYISFLFFKVS